MTDHIELHDSRLAVKFTGSAVVLELRPAYVHHWEQSSTGWRGEGRTQSADIVIANAALGSSPGDDTFVVSDGWFEVGGVLHDNVVPVPLDEAAAVRGRIVLVNGGPIDLSGDALTVRVVGKPERVEDLPSEWAPK
jgi:hypothetical protein